MDPSSFSCSGNYVNSPNSTEEQNKEDKNAMIETTLDLINKGETKIELSDRHKNVILILGNTGSGKSTFTQWIAGDNSKLIAKETNEGTGEFIIIDNNRIGNSTIKSKTVFPELVIDAKTNSAYYDCPGFSDTITANDIATNYFIKKVIDHAESIKMIFLVNHSSVRKGVDRLDFMKLMKHATDLIKDIDKFRKSVALVATKVDNQYVKLGKSFVLVDSEKVIEAIGDFLREVEQDLKKMNHASTKDRTFHEKAIKLVDVLLERDDGHYSKIGIFRRPDEPGPLSNITLLQDGKEHIQRIILERLRFTKKDDGDFGHTVSERSKNDIGDLVETINKRIWCDVNTIANGIHEHYRNLTEKFRSEVKSFVTNSVDVKTDVSEAQSLSMKLRNGYNITSNLAEIDSETNIEDLAKTLSSIDTEDANIYTNYVSDIANQGKYFNILQTVSEEKLSKWPWTELFKGVTSYLSESRKTIQEDVQVVADQLINLIRAVVDKVTSTMQEHFENNMKSLEIQKLPNKIRRDYNIMLRMSKEMEHLTNTEELSTTIRDATDNLNMCIPAIYLQNITNYGEYFGFLQIITERELKDVSSTWAHSFENITRHLNESIMWYNFLNDLYLKFSEYEIQKERDKYNVADLRNWGKSGKTSGIEINRNTYELFLSKVAKYNLIGYDNITSITVTGLRLEELNHVLSITLKHTVSTSCKEPYIFIKGDYINIKDTILSRDTEVDRSCLHFSSLLDSGKFKSINIFAFNTVFIDSDLLLEKLKLPLTVIAPKWEIVGTRQINLSGADAKSLFSFRARDGTLEGSNGVHGKLGEPGESGGNFFGIGRQFVNGSNLRITANGGKGSSGQNGGNGQSGRDGNSPWTPSGSTVCHDLCDNGRKINNFKCETYTFPPPPKTGSSWFNMPILTAAVFRKMYYSSSFDYKMFGTPGSRGGNGGNGGKGGRGGNIGTITLLEIEGSSGILKHAEKGADGRDGIGGRGGPGGHDGNHIVARCTKTDPTDILYLFTSSTIEWETKLTIENHHIAPSGINGRDGVGTAKCPEPAITIESEAKVINEYKSFLRESLTDRFKKHSSTQFLYQLDSNNKTKNVYDTLGLVNELETLEKQYYNLNEELNFLPFYQSLLNKVNKYAESPKRNEASIEYNKVLKYLFTATLSRIYSLKDSAESYLIIDIDEYLNIIKGDILILKNQRNAKVKANVIKKYKDNYKSSIDDKIKEAENFIKEQMMPEMDLINGEIDREIDSLIDEIIELKKKSKEEINELVEKRENLKKAFAVRGIFNCLKIFAQVASFLGPVGKVVGLATGTVISITESLVLDKQGETVNIPESNVPYLPLLKKEIQTVKIKKFTCFQDLLEEMSREVSDHLEELGDLSLKIDHLKNGLNDAKRNGFDLKQITTLQNELKRELSKKREELKTENRVSMKKREKTLKIIKKFEQIAELGSLFADIINQKKNEEEKIDVINSAILLEEDKFYRLQEDEDQVYSTIAPLLQNMENYLDNVINKLATKSQVSLDVTKWRVQSVLKDMKLQIHQLTRNFEDSNTAFERCIEKLDDVLATSINIYDRIQSYQQDQNLANFIADITSTVANNIYISDPKLLEAVNDLDILIRSNLVLMQYKTVINALKQWVFPFAHNYLEKSQLPSHFELDGTIDSVVSVAMEQIGEIKRKIGLYKVFVTKDDEYKFTGEFKRRYISSKPFFEWKNDQYKNEISKLFSGQEITLKADVRHSPTTKYAIKFSSIDLNFTSKNNSLQTQINNTLAGFDIKMTHMGNSYYRYADKFYLITSKNVTIIHSWETDDAQIPIRKNDVYGKIKNGNLTLSPYAVWKIKLIKATDEIPFQKLESYRDQIDLELIGSGSYVDSEYNIVVPIDDEYEAIETFDEGSPFLLEENKCTKSNKRYSRSVKHIDVINHVTSSAAPRSSSLINYLVNSIKTCILSNILPSISGILLTKRDTFCEDSLYEKPSQTTENSSEDNSNVVSLISETQRDDIDGVAQENETTTLSHSFNEDNNLISDDGTIDMDCNHIFCDNSDFSSSYSKSFINDKQNSHFLSVPNINCSLLLADLITRYVTGNKYKYSAHKLLSPEEVVKRKINDGIIRNEVDARSSILKLQREAEIKHENSWLSTIKAYAISSLQLLGLVEKENIDVYIQDVRHLFTQ